MTVDAELESIEQGFRMGYGEGGEKLEVEVTWLEEGVKAQIVYREPVETQTVEVTLTKIDERRDFWTIERRR